MQLVYNRFETRHWITVMTHCIALITIFCLPISISVYSIGLKLLVACSFISIVQKQQWQQLKINPLFWTILLFLSMVLLGCLYSISSVTGWHDDFFKYSRLFFIPLLMPVFLSKTLRQQAIYAFLIGVFVCIVLIYAKQLGLVRFRMGVPAEYGFASHIETSFLVAWASYLALYSFKQHSQKWRYIFLAAFAFFAVYLFTLNIGRLGQCLFLLLTALFCLQTFGWRLALLAIGLLAAAVILAFFVSPLFHDHTLLAFQEIGQAKNGVANAGSVGSRFTMAANTFTLFLQAPWLGHGSGSYHFIYDIKRFGLPAGVPVVNSPHNDFLLVLAQLGVIGIVFYSAIFVALACMIKRLPKSIKPCAQALLLAVVAGAFFNDIIYRSMIGSAFVLFAALFWALYLQPTSHQESKEHA